MIRERGGSDQVERERRGMEDNRLEVCGIDDSVAEDRRGNILE